jgi:hypothetical protein
VGLERASGLPVRQRQRDKEMSFIITTLSNERIVQVSDTRLSALADQSRLSETLRKTLIVKGTKARLVVGWAGLATTDAGHNTNDWLFRVLYEMNAVERSPDEIIGCLKDIATQHFQTLRALDKCCHFVLAGWEKPSEVSQPFLGIVSNSISLDSPSPIGPGLRDNIPSFPEASAAAPEFQGLVQRFVTSTERNYVVNVLGDFNPEKLKLHFPRGSVQIRPCGVTAKPAI